MSTPISPTVSIAATAAIPAARLAQIKKTAQQFEAIFVRQMLAAARKSNFGDTPTSSQGADSFMDMQDSRFADIASQKGAFGLAHMIEKQLIRRQSQSAGNVPPASAAGAGAGAGAGAASGAGAGAPTVPALPVPGTRG